MESIGLDVKNIESALYSLSTLETAEKHKWGWSLPIFKTPTEQVHLAVSFGKGSYSSFHFHEHFRQCVYMLEGCCNIQVTDLMFSLIPPVAKDSDFQVGVFDVDLEDLPNSPFECLVIPHGAPHRLVFPEPCLFIETYSKLSNGFNFFEADVQQGFSAPIGVSFDIQDEPASFDIHRVDEGGSEKFEENMYSDLSQYHRYMQKLEEEHFKAHKEDYLDGREE